MNSRVVKILLVVACVVLAGVALLAAIHSKELEAQLRDAETSRQKSSTSPAIRDEGMAQLLADQEAANAKLRTEIAGLKKALAEKPEVVERTSEVADARQNGPGAWLDRIKKDDPERYKQIMEQREQRRKAVDQLYQDRLAQLQQEAQEATSPDEAQLANQIAEQLSKLNELRSQWASLRNMAEDERREAAQQLGEEQRDAMTQLRTFRDDLRTIQIGNLLKTQGIQDPKVIETITTGIPQIYQNTDYTRQGGQQQWREYEAGDTMGSAVQGSRIATMPNPPPPH